MRILTAEEMRACDQATFSGLGVPSRTIMESAGREVTRILLSEFSTECTEGILVLTGSGNNAGDGFVVARTANNLGLEATVASLKPLRELKGDAKANADSFIACGGEVVELSGESWSEQEVVLGMGGFGVVVDAIFGTGLCGEVRGFAVDIISEVNRARCEFGVPVVAVDVPSGVEADTGRVLGVGVSATATVALQCLKPCHVLFPGAANAGSVYVADIGVLIDAPEPESVCRELLTKEVAAGMLLKVIFEGPECHKGERGHLLVVGGGQGHFGAPKLSARAGLVSGAGLVTMLLPRLGARALAPTLDELMCGDLEDDEDGNFSSKGAAAVSEYLSNKQAVVLGPGMGQSKGAKSLLEAVLSFAGKKKLPLVLDADALNILVQSPELQKKVPAHAVCTPHPGEMARFLSSSSAKTQDSRIESAQSLSRRLACTVVLKGARTIISDADGNVWINPSAVATLSTAGSGDVLSGMIGAFLARGLDPVDAACAAVFVHGAAGEVLYSKFEGTCGLVAGDIIEAIPRVLNAILPWRGAPLEMLEKVLPSSFQLN